nr:MAG TPA: hypothetical protein [Caudoviricetes sp.]
MSQRVQLSMVINFPFHRKRGRHVPDVQILLAKHTFQSQSNDVYHPNYYKYRKRSISQIENRRSNSKHFYHLISRSNQKERVRNAQADRLLRHDY